MPNTNDRAGHYKVWPFPSVANDKTALPAPKLLGGRDKTAAQNMTKLNRF
jgi:hypothetical protein